MKLNTYIIALISLAYCCIFYSCETEFTPEINSEPPEIVVEGYIEAGDRPSPPYLILTKTFPFYSTFDRSAIDELYIHDAIITVDNGSESIQLTEICLDELTPAQQVLVSDLFGINTDSINIQFCIYTDLTFSMFGEPNKTYELTIETEDETLTASTYIPTHVPLDSVVFEIPPEVADTLMEMECSITDPDSITSYYRYSTSINGENFIPGFNSVFDDAFIDGKSFTFPLSKGETRDTRFNPETFGLYTKGDSITLKWTTIDDPHYRFWNTLEFNAVNQGPFSNYTKIESNIEGGIGIWGGINATYYDRIVEE